MRVDGQVLVTIVLMALVIYATRAGGLWLVSRLELSGRAEAWLGYLPGAIIVSIAAPIVLAGRAPEALAAAVVLVALRTGSLPLAMATGVVAVLALRALLSGLT